MGAHRMDGRREGRMNELVGAASAYLGILVAVIATTTVAIIGAVIASRK